MNRLKRKMLFGLGLDNKDGHKRITRGENFNLFGGSEETHENMQEKAIKLNEQLKKKGKTFDTVNDQELEDIYHKLGINIQEPKKGETK